MVSSYDFRLLTESLHQKWNRLYICSKHRQEVGPKLPGRLCQTASHQR